MWLVNGLGIIDMENIDNRTKPNVCVCVRACLGVCMRAWVYACARVCSRVRQLLLDTVQTLVVYCSKGKSVVVELEGYCVSSKPYHKSHPDSYTWGSTLLPDAFVCGSPSYRGHIVL